MNSKFSILLLIALSTAGASLLAQTASETDAQRRLREDRERFRREVERQAGDARIREERARAAASEQRTAEELERQRIQQSRQTQALESLQQKDRMRDATPTPPALVYSATPTSAQPQLPPAGIVPDFSVTFLADGNCVIYRKDRPPEVRSIADAENILADLLRARASAPAPEKK